MVPSMTGLGADSVHRLISRAARVNATQFCSLKYWVAVKIAFSQEGFQHRC